MRTYKKPKSQMSALSAQVSSQAVTLHECPRHTLRTSTIEVDAIILGFGDCLRPLGERMSALFRKPSLLIC